jgi:hypothetical protein
MQPDNPRMPCRGCTVDCPNYSRCDGKPWRLDTQAESSSGAGRSEAGRSEINIGESLAP